MTPPAVRAAIEAVWRIEAGRLVAALTRLVHDLGRPRIWPRTRWSRALSQWPTDGIPDNPGAWLMAVARRRAIDAIRRQVSLEQKVELIGRDLTTEHDPLAELQFERHVEDDVLNLIFMTCHPVLAADARIALTLKAVGGLSTDEIASAFLVAPNTISQRISRAKKTLTEAGARFEVPVGTQLDERLASVLEVVYLIFNEGYAASSGDDWTRPALCDEAMRLGRMLAALDPGAAQIHGLVALMEIQASRLRARTGPNGEIITLLDQDRSRWDRTLISHALGALERALALGGERGWYVLQASIVACHARAATSGDTDWAQIAALYGVLGEVAPSPVVELNRAVASRWRTGRGRRSPSSMRCSRSPRCANITCCPASGPTCWPSSAAAARPGPSSNARPR